MGIKNETKNAHKSGVGTKLSDTMYQENETSLSTVFHFLSRKKNL